MRKNVMCIKGEKAQSIISTCTCPEKLHEVILEVVLKDGWRFKESRWTTPRQSRPQAKTYRRECRKSSAHFSVKITSPSRKHGSGRCCFYYFNVLT